MALPHQKELIDFFKTNKRALIDWDTGSGKNTAALMCAQGRPIIFLSKEAGYVRDVTSKSYHKQFSDKYGVVQIYRTSGIIPFMREVHDGLDLNKVFLVIDPDLVVSKRCRPLIDAINAAPDVRLLLIAYGRPTKRRIEVIRSLLR